MSIKVCNRCVLDTTVPDLVFDKNRECNYCKIHDALEEQYPLGSYGRRILLDEIRIVKEKGKSKKYDCVVGISGGTDSTFVLYLAKVIFGLRPLAVHFDNGWNSEVAVRNVKNATDKLDVDLYTLVADWEQFKDLQRSFFAASVSDVDISTDYVIYSTLLSVASKFNIPSILEGHSFRAEGTVPIGWTYMDGTYVNDVQDKYGTMKIDSFPIMTIFQLLYYLIWRRIKYVRPLEYLNFNKEKAKKLLIKELDWEYSGGHHHESTFTHFFQSYYLPNKFNIDKRKIELSANIRSGYLEREKALKELQEDYPYNQELVNYSIKKLDFSEEDFKNIMTSPNKKFTEFNTNIDKIKLLSIPIFLATKLGILPTMLYEKYAKFKK
tara:strand:- start:2320 stop:3459 length:1140 start_codon:yes stop_codon:yes gene_type:complete